MWNALVKRFFSKIKKQKKNLAWLQNIKIELSTVMFLLSDSKCIESYNTITEKDIKEKFRFL